MTNPALMDNHQSELATALSPYLIAADVATAAAALAAAAATRPWAALEPYPPRRGGAFAALLEDEMAAAEAEGW